MPSTAPEGAAPGPLGLLGGTFDPIHLAHLRLAEEAREALGLERVRLIPAGDPPHRDTPQSAAEHRLAMAQRAIAGNPALEVDDGEIRARQKSYTVLTLERLRAEFGAQRPLVLLLGADAFQTVRHVVLPQLGSALLAGALLAFALSFDEVIVTTFTAGQQTTLPIWMLQELIRPRQRPVTNVVAVFVIALTFVPILAAYALTRADEPTR